MYGYTHLKGSKIERMEFLLPQSELLPASLENCLKGLSNPWMIVYLWLLAMGLPEAIYL